MKTLFTLFIFLFSSCLVSSQYAKYLEELAHKYREFYPFSMEYKNLYTVNTNEYKSSTAIELYNLYGGSAGNAAFENYRDNFIEPILKDYFDYLKNQSNLQPDSLTDLMTKLGDWRRAIALFTSSQNAMEYGQKNTGQMRDPVSANPQWKNWKEAIVEKIIDIIVSGKLENIDDSKLVFIKNNEILTAYVDYLNERIPQLTLIGEKLAGDYKVQLQELSNYQLGEILDFDKLKSYLPISELAFLRKHIGQLLIITKPEIEELNKQKNATNIEAFKNKFERILNRYQSIMDFSHTSERYNAKSSQYFQDFKNALFWTQEQSLDQLKIYLARILWHLSHSSTYLRGQATITEWLLGALALTHGKKLKLPKQDLSIDQQSLLYLSLDQFLKMATAIIILD